MIKIEGTLLYKENATQPVNFDRADTYISQVSKDAVLGTFGDFPAFWSQC